MTMQSDPISGQSYIERNHRWLFPLAGTFIVVVVPALLEMFRNIDPTNASKAADFIPKTLIGCLALIGATLAGLGAHVTETTSALIFRRLIVVAGFVAVIRFVSHMLLGH